MTVDFDGVTDAIAAFGPQVVTAGGLVLVAGLGVMALFWGAPRLISLFKRTAK